MIIVGIIPARYDSTRFPGKPLVDLMGKPMIQHVVEQCQKAKYLSDVIVATDDERIAEAVRDFGGRVIMTASTHNSGTERCAECLNYLDEQPDFVINIQGDEPLIQPAQIDDLCETINQKQPELLTLVRKMTEQQDIESSNVVKVVTDVHEKALYFSRSPIPFPRNGQLDYAYQHVGIYAYRTDILKQIVELPISRLERLEQLEQLRWLENGYSIQTQETNYPTIAIDHPDDVLEVINQMKNGR